ncbi:MAG: Lacal_2735 family protein [Cyclobacteriaceae bacterium]
MFGLFKKKSELEQLQDQYAKLMEKAHKMSHQNRKEADRLMSEAEEIGKNIDQAKK